VVPGSVNPGRQRVAHLQARPQKVGSYAGIGYTQNPGRFRDAHVLYVAQYQYGIPADQAADG